MGAVGTGNGHRERDQAGRGQAEADPLAAPDHEAEQPLGHDADQDDAAGEDDLDDRERRHRHRRDVEDPRADGDHDAQREPLRPEQGAGGPQGMPDVDGRDLARAPMLVEEREVRHEGAEEREE